jgi:hypothetical protein
MTSAECRREADVLSMARSGREDEELTRHVAGCVVCRDVLTIANLARDAYVETYHDAELPSAAQVWWRASVRARADAAETASRPLTWIHGLAAACAAGLAAVAISAVWPAWRGTLEDLAFQASNIDIAAAAEVVAGIARQSAPLLVAAACLVVAPIALYFALSDK